MKVKSESEVTQSCPTPCDPMDCCLPGPYVHGIFQARVLEWGATAFPKLVSAAAAKWLQSCPGILQAGRQQIKNPKKHRKEEILYLLTHEGALSEYETELSGVTEKSPRLRGEAPESTESPTRNRQEETLAPTARPAAGTTRQHGEVLRVPLLQAGRRPGHRKLPPSLFYSRGTGPCVTQLIQEKTKF